MKRFFPVLMVLLMLFSAARAEVVGRAGDDYIHRWTAPNGQELYYVSKEEDPFVQMKDVNFDGVEDVVVITFRGAANFGVAFFVWNGGSYVLAEHPGADSLVNYDLYPEAGLIVTGVSDGVVGHTRELWRWNGTNLERMRHAVTGPLETIAFDGDLMIQTTDDSLVRVRIWDDLHPTTENGVTSAALLLDKTVDAYDTQAVSALRDEEWRVLTEGFLP